MLNLLSTILLLFSATSYAVINGSAVTVSGTTLCNNGTIEKTFAGTMTTTCGAGWSVGELGTVGPEDPVSQFAYSYPLDTFEYTTETLPTYGSWAPSTGVQYLWMVDEDDNGGNLRPQTLSVDQGAGLFGANSNAMRVDVTGSQTGAGGMFLRLYNNHNTNVNDYWFVKDLTNPPDEQRINRMRFWIKVPPQQDVSTDVKQFNFHVGTYQMLSAGTDLDGESNGWHHYHYYNFEDSDNWIQVIVDQHPHHIRNNPNGPNADLGVLTNMETGYNYFDLTSYFYLAAKVGYTSDPAFTLVDGIEFYEAPAEDEENIYGLSATISTNGELLFRFSVHKNKVNELLDIKYAFTSFHDNGGFTHGTYAPSGQNIDPPATNNGGYNGAEYRTSAINYGTNDAIYLAIKNQNEPTLFREIRIPITAQGYPYIPTTSPDMTEPTP